MRKILSLLCATSLSVAMGVSPAPYTLRPQWYAFEARSLSGFFQKRRWIVLRRQQHRSQINLLGGSSHGLPGENLLRGGSRLTLARQ